MGIIDCSKSIIYLFLILCSCNDNGNEKDIFLGSTYEGSQIARKFYLYSDSTFEYYKYNFFSIDTTFGVWVDSSSQILLECCETSDCSIKCSCGLITKDYDFQLVDECEEKFLGDVFRLRMKFQKPRSSH